MGKPTGFIEYLRELPIDRTPAERVKDWREFHPRVPEDRLGVRTGAKLEVSVDAFPGETFQGRVARVAPVLDQVAFDQKLQRFLAALNPSAG